MTAQKESNTVWELLIWMLSTLWKRLNNRRRDKRSPGGKRTVTDTSAVSAKNREMWLNLWEKPEILSR